MTDDTAADDTASIETATVEPIRLSVTVPMTAAEAFEFFTEQIHEWWPYQSHSVGSAKVAAVVFTGGPGGRLYERWHDGHESDWGEVLAWEPPRRFVVTWHPNPSATVKTEVEVRFLAVDGESTTVELEHRGWERLGSLADAARTEYSSGWPSVLAHLVRVAELRRPDLREPSRPEMMPQAVRQTGR